MNAQENKKLQQGKLLEVKNQIDKLNKRKGELEADLKQTLESVQARSQAISEAMLAGTDTSKYQAALQSEETKVNNLRSALALADTQRTELFFQRDETEKHIVMYDLFSANDEVERQLMICVNKFHDAVLSLEKIEPLYRTLTTVGSGTNVDNYDETRFTTEIYLYLRGAVIGHEELQNRLKGIEERYSDYLKEVRAKFPAK